MRRNLLLGPIILVCCVGMVQSADLSPSPGRIAVFADAQAPKLTLGCANPRRLGDLLRTPQRSITFLTAEQLAAPEQLSTKSFDLLVLPYGPGLPEAATDSVRSFLRAGGDFVSVGGYAFDNLYGGKANPLLELLEAPGLEEEDSIERWQSDQAGIQGADLDTLGRSIVPDSPHSGASCVRLRVPDGLPKAWYNVNQRVAGLVPGESYSASCWIRTEDVHGGFAYLAVGFYDGTGTRLSFAQNTGGTNFCGTANWRRLQCRFEVPPGTVTVRVVGNLYGYGTAYFDDFSLKWAEVGGLNTHFGQEGDQLRFSRDQIGVFDPSYRLEQAVSSHTSRHQQIVTSPCDLQASLAGYAAVGMTSPNDAVGPKPRARWTSLVQGRDSYGRLTGSLMGLTHNFNDTFKHSLWAYVGVENLDVFDGSHATFDMALQQVVDHILTGVFLHTPTSEFMLYRPGEQMRANVNLCNSGRETRDLRVIVEAMLGDRVVGADEHALSLTPGQDEAVAFELPCPRTTTETVCKLRYQLRMGQRTVDTVRTGVFVPNGREESGFPLSFKDNYFRAGGRPMMLFGVNQTGVMFGPHYENPLTWAQDYGRCRDFGFNVWRVLHVSAFADPAGYRFGTFNIGNPPERLLRRMDAAFQLAQHYNLVPMPCWHDTKGGAAVSDRELEFQAGFARRYGERYRNLSAMLYDVSNETTVDYADVPDLQRDFRAFLTRRYGHDDALRAAWQDPEASLASARYARPEGQWHSRRDRDIEVFRLYVMERWLTASINTVRDTGDTHPVTTENYVSKLPGGDPFESRRHLTFANMHHYGDWQPGYARFFGRRMQGKGHVIGEFGRNSHPGQVNFRTYCPEPEALAYFRRVTFLNAGLGAAGLFVWDVKDMRGSGFPYGIHYHSELVPKKVGYQFRNLAFFFRRFALEFQPEALWFVVPDQLLLGGRQNDLQVQLYSALTALTRTNIQFSTIRQYELPKILEHAPTAIMLPLAYILSDGDVETLVEYARNGGTVYLSGDCAFTPDREETRGHVLTTLVGIKPGHRRYPDLRYQLAPAVSAEAVRDLPAYDARPTYELNPTGADVLRQAGPFPLVCARRVGKGKVVFVNDPIELHLSEEELLPVYAEFATRAGLRPLLKAHTDSKLIALQTHTERKGALTVALNDGTQAQTVDIGDVELACPAGAQVAVHRTRSGEIVALALAGNAAIDGKPFRTSTGHLLLAALDEKDLRRSQAILALPLSRGNVGLAGIDDGLTAHVGEVVDGHWMNYERIPNGQRLEVDDLRATTMILLTRPKALKKWAGRVEDMVLKPEAMPR
ncbi:MAG: hypothetical protein HN742_17415 [Lentisphaerae bacterium]|jgi:hypothetical protein|nr:hypothetical protein [Lentisphaerota bacterium]MBT4818529.1 hypothetical protein [Lentisphaerota bacterium]MBT5605681.1 hypothetical protein [Lentisphaerota bacterium]MBT7056300.1 hypothetical protein [Lentisphaerota bacterium]MBT7843661.1 hypothetical protein [Lentisphaerota bacterium]